MDLHLYLQEMKSNSNSHIMQVDLKWRFRKFTDPLILSLIHYISSQQLSTQGIQICIGRKKHGSLDQFCIKVKFHVKDQQKITHRGNIAET